MCGDLWDANVGSVCDYLVDVMRIMTDQHTYPSNYPPGTHWAIDAAWEILDVFKPGAINPDNRALLAGMIAGRLVKERRDVLMAVVEAQTQGEP